MTVTHTVITEYNYDNMAGVGYDTDTAQLPYEQFGYVCETVSNEVDTITGSDSESLTLNVPVVDYIVPVDTTNVKLRLIDFDGVFVADSETSGVTVSSNDGISGSDSSGVEVNVLRHQYFGLFDEDESEPNTLLSDIELDNKFDSDEEFHLYCNRKSPVGYVALRPLYPGDYEYQEAIVGVQVMLNDPAAGSYGVVGCTLNVDVEDVVDKGTQVLPAAEIIVPFTKKFYAIPKVFCQVLTAAGGARPVITEITNQPDEELGSTYGYFKVSLESFTTSEKVAGTIDWLAQGF